MTTTLRNLGQRLQSHVDDILKRSAERTNNAAIAMVKTLALTTPVDTSQALSNWIVGVGSVDSSFIGPWVPGLGGSTQVQSAYEAVEMARVMLKGRKFGTVFYVSNNAPYIVGLENETISRQPGRFVARGLLTFRLTYEGSLK